MERFTFPITLTPDEVDGGFVVTCRDLPEAITQGDTVDECLSEAEGALESAMHARISRGWDIPEPSEPLAGEYPVTVPITTALKAALYLAMREDGVSKSELARRLAVDEKEVRRMLDPRHATKAPALERALTVMRRRVTVDVRRAA